ncbi:MAG: hypothetical protein ACPG4Z_01665 [Chitinophagales bacterium]
MKKIISSIQTSTHPIMEVVQQSKDFKVIAIGLNEGVALKKHTAPKRAKILVVKGTVKYTSTRETVNINCFEEYNIPLEEEHEVSADKEAIFLLILG